MAPAVPSDIEISRAARPRPITEIAAAAGIPAEFVEPYGDVKAKVKLRSSTAWRAGRTASTST